METVTRKPSQLTPHKLAYLFPRTLVMELDDLERDIAKRGQLQPIWITLDNEILDGKMRVAACLRLKQYVICNVCHSAPDTYFDLVVSLNMYRRQLSTKQYEVIRLQVRREEAKGESMVDFEPLRTLGTPWDISDWTLSKIATWDAAAKRAEPGAQWVRDFEAGKEQV